MLAVSLTFASLAVAIAFLLAPRTAITASRAPEATSTGQVGQLLPGDPVRGKELFTGVARFQKGGPPCLACHSVGGIGALGGGQLGPDLTAIGLAAQTLAGQQAVIQILTDFTGRPTMQAVWGQHPLTDQERADVVAFLTQAAIGRRPTGVVLILLAIAVVGSLAFWGLALVIWRRRLREVRRPLVVAVTAGRSQ